MARPRNLPPDQPDNTPDASASGAELAKGRPASAAALKAPAVTKPNSAAGRKTAGAFVEGRAVRANLQTAEVIRVKASEHPNFILTHDPVRWGYYPQVDRILPDFGKIRLVPGIGRVDAKGRPDAALVDATRAGRVVIYDAAVEGGYLREFDMLGGVGYLPRWEHVKVSGRIAKIEVDFPAFLAFSATLLEDGVIEPPDEGTIVHLRDMARNMIDLASPRKEQPRIQAEIAMYEKQIAACDALLASEV